MSYAKAYLLFFKYNKIAVRQTISSVAGKEHQTPVTPAREERRSAIGTITANPRNIEIKWAGSAWSTDVN